MKISIPGARIFASLGLTAGLMIGCTDFLGAGKDTNGTAQTPVEESGTLSLSIKDDSSCREQWGDILAARSAGHADSAGETVFLANCVKEIRVTKDTPKPTIPPALLPDSGTRCKWIATQIEGGRDSLTVSYKKYCPDDCRILAIKDSAGHEKLCHLPGDLPPKTRPDDSGVVVKPRDTLIVKPDPTDDTCAMLHRKLEATNPGEPGRAEQEKMVLAHCGKLPDPVPADTCRMMYDHLMKMDPASADYAKAKEAWHAHCGGIVPPKPDPEVDTCMLLLERLAKLDPASEEYLKYKHIWAERCGGVVPPKDTVIIKPPVVNCDELRKQLAGLDPTSGDYAHVAVTLKEHCPEKPPVVIVPKPIPTTLDSICMELKLRLSKATTDAQRAELEAAYKAKCLEPVLVNDPVVTPVSDCDAAHKKMSMVDPASADYAVIAGYIREHCPEVAPVK